MTRFDKRRIKPNWESLSKWEDDNQSLVICAVTTDCIRQRMTEINQEFAVRDSLIYEFIYHTRRGWDMEMFKNMFKDFVIEKLKEEVEKNE